MSEANSAEIRSAAAYSDMLVRQHPFIRELLRADERPIAFSYRNAEVFHGVFILLLGVFCALDPVIQFAGFPAWAAAAAALIGAALIWLGVWLIWFRKRSYVLVTTRRVLCRGVNPFGKPGRLREIDRADIQRVRWLKSTVMYRIGRKDGAIALTLKNGGSVVLSGVREAETVFTSIR